MKVARYPIKISNKKSTLILGSFEALHYGHVSLIDLAKQDKQTITMLMIESPSKLPGKKTGEYCAFETRLVQVANIGVDQVIVLNFTNEIKNKDGETFLKELIEISNATHIIVGKDFAMGHNRTMTAEKIKILFPNTTLVEPIKFNETKLSTTTLKELVEVGQMDIIKKLSPFSYTITTRVSDSREFEINTVMPQRGIYAAFTIVNDIKYWSLIKVGFNKNTILIPDLQITNSGFDARIEMRKLIRIITRESHDILTEEDQQKVISYLINNQ